MPNKSFTTLLNKALPKLVNKGAEDMMKACDKKLRHKISVQCKIELKKSINLIKHSPILNDDDALNHTNPT